MQCWNLSSWNTLLLQHGPEELLFWALITYWVLQERKKASNMEQPSCQGEKQMGSSQSYTDCLSQVLSQPILEMGKHGAGARWKELMKLSSIITSTRPVKRQHRTAFQAHWSQAVKHDSRLSSCFSKCLSAEWQLPNSPTCLAPMKHREHPQKHKTHLWSWKSSPLGNRHRQGWLEVSLLTWPQVLAGRQAATAQAAPGFTPLWLPVHSVASKQSRKPLAMAAQFPVPWHTVNQWQTRRGEGLAWPSSFKLSEGCCTQENKPVLWKARPTWRYQSSCPTDREPVHCTSSLSTAIHTHSDSNNRGWSEIMNEVTGSICLTSPPPPEDAIQGKYNLKAEANDELNWFLDEKNRCHCSLPAFSLPSQSELQENLAPSPIPHPTSVSH